MYMCQCLVEYMYIYDARDVKWGNAMSRVIK